MGHPRATQTQSQSAEGRNAPRPLSPMSTQFDPRSPNVTQGFGVLLCQIPRANYQEPLFCQIPGANYQGPLLLAASFVKDRPRHYFFALERISNSTICSPMESRKKGLSRKKATAAKKLSTHGVEQAFRLAVRSNQKTLPRAAGLDPRQARLWQARDPPRMLRAAG